MNVFELVKVTRAAIDSESEEEMARLAERLQAECDERPENDAFVSIAWGFRAELLKRLGRDEEANHAWAVQKRCSAAHLERYKREGKYPLPPWLRDSDVGES